MPGPKAKAIELSEGTRDELETLRKGHKTAQQIAKRAQIILAAAEGQSNSAISREVGLTRQTVISWRNRWEEMESVSFGDASVAERLEDLPRSGAPAQITAEVRCQLEALACQAPQKEGRPISQWTGREIADELVKRKIVECISPRHAGRLLKRCLNSSSP